MHRRLFGDKGHEASLLVAAAALAVGIRGVEIDAISFVQDEFLIAPTHDNRSLAHKIELLPAMRHQLRRLVGRMQDNQ